MANYNFEIQILKMAIVTYNKNIDTFMEMIDMIPFKYNQKILKEYKKISDAEKLIIDLRYKSIKKKLK